MATYESNFNFLDIPSMKKTLRNFTPEIFFEDVHCHLVQSAVSTDDPKPNQVKI